MTKNLSMMQVVAAEEKRKAESLERMTLRPRPTFEVPTVPLRVAELSDVDLMKLFVALTRWTDYFATLLAQAEVEERSANYILDKAKALGLMKAMSSGGRDERVTVAKAEVASDPEIVQYETVAENAYAKRKFTLVHFEAAERDAALVSRELTRRVGKKESNERRADRWGGGA